MDYRVILSPKAVSDLEAIVRYIARRNPDAAKRVGQSLLNKAQELKQFPFKGKKVPEMDDSDIRQVVLSPYRIVYRVDQDKKQVIIRFPNASTSEQAYCDTYQVGSTWDYLCNPNSAWRSELNNINFSQPGS